MTKKNRKHNAQKRYRRFSEALLKFNNLATVFVSGTDGKTYMIDHKTGMGITATPSLIKVVTELPFRWSVFMAVMCIDHDSKKYMKYEEVLATDPVRQSELADFLNSNHKALVESCNTHHVVNAGWLASPIGYEWSEESAFNLFMKRGAWEVNDA